MRGLAPGAGPGADVQRHRLREPAARRAHLAGGEPPVDRDHLAAVPGGLYSSIVRNSDHEASEMARASLPLASMPRTLRSSITTVWFSRTSRVVTLCRWSRLRS